MSTRCDRWPAVVLLATALSGGGPLFAQMPGNDVRSELAKVQDVEHRFTEGFVNGIPVKFAENPSPSISVHSGGVISGYAGINQYFANIEVAADGGFSLESPGFAVTRVTGEPQRVDAEAAFLNTLRGTAFIRPESDGIAFETADRAVRLKFIRATVTQALSDLLNVELSLVRFVSNGKEIALPSKVTITLTLRDSGQLSGRSAVNNYGAGYTATQNGSFAVQGIIASQMAGAPELMALEKAYFDALSAVSRVSVKGDHVILENDTASLEFAPVRSRVASVRPSRKKR
jgi:heat shock protein HslJ